MAGIITCFYFFRFKGERKLQQLVSDAIGHGGITVLVS